MTNKAKLKDRARDELFSHINRCAVIGASEEDQKHWMQETMEYLGERYPDLNDADLQELFQLGMRFCAPAIPHGRPGATDAADATEEPAEPSVNGSATPAEAAEEAAGTDREPVGVAS
jgi:hypothetical protein